MWRTISLLTLAVILNSCATNRREYQVNSIVYWQTGAEARALYYQAFNVARQRLDTILNSNKTDRKPLAVVVDIDETLLDNSRYQVTQLRSGIGYTSASWKGWTAKATAQATPGSVEFLQYARRQNVHVFYVTNRTADDEDATLRNLSALGFPWTDKEHFYPQEITDRASKESRRKEIAEKYDIVLLIGDNLTDFSSVFEIPGIEPRKEAVDHAKMLFGERYIILPNPMYGDWETLGVYDGRNDLSESEKNRLRKSVLQGE